MYIVEHLEITFVNLSRDLIPDLYIFESIRFVDAVAQSWRPSNGRLSRR